MVRGRGENPHGNRALIVALQDLNDAERAVVERLPSFENEISSELASYLSEERNRAAEQSARLEGWLDALHAPETDAPNIWLRAVLDDAARDYETIVPGPLRDIALVGAFRKGKQAERVSYETAVGLARVTGQTELEKHPLLRRDEEGAADRLIAQLLESFLARVQ